jgi:hypothetical protein
MILIYCKWGFRPVAVVGKIVQKNRQETAICGRRNRHAKQYRNTVYTKYKTNIQDKKTNIQRILQNKSRVIIK